MKYFTVIIYFSTCQTDSNTFVDKYVERRGLATTDAACDWILTYTKNITEPIESIIIRRQLIRKEQPT